MSRHRTGASAGARDGFPLSGSLMSVRTTAADTWAGIRVESRYTRRNGL